MSRPYEIVCGCYLATESLQRAARAVASELPKGRVAHLGTRQARVIFGDGSCVTVYFGGRKPLPSDYDCNSGPRAGDDLSTPAPLRPGRRTP